MGRIVGVGGVFMDFRGEKESLHKWYYDVLGLDMTAYGSGFLEGAQLMLVSFKKDMEGTPMINFRVDDLNAVKERLEADGVLVRNIVRYDYGIFGQFQDPFGNLVEIWEPFEDAYRKMVASEIDQYIKENAQ